MPSLAPVLAVVTVFVSTSSMQVETRFVLALLHAYSYTSIDTDKVVQEFCTRKPRSLAFEFWTHVRKPSLNQKDNLDPSAYPSDSARKLFLPGLHAQKSSGVNIARLTVHSALHFMMPFWNSLRKMIVT